MRRATGVLLAIALSGCSAAGPSLLDSPGNASRQPAEMALPAVRMASGSDALVLTLGADVGLPGGAAPHLRAEIAYTATARRTYDTARDLQGRALATRTLPAIDSCKPGPPCLYQENVRVALPIDELRQSQSIGYRLKLVARNGLEIEIGIPGAQIAALLARMEAPSASAAVVRKGN